MRRFVICLAATFGIIFGGALWFHVMKLIFGPENAFVYAMMELAAISIAGIVWAFWNMVSPEKEEEEKDQTVRIELIGQDLFKYEGDRIEKVGAMWEAKDWMEPLMKKTDWDQCMAAVEDRNRIKTIRKLARQMDYREARKEKEVTEVELRSNFAADTYELVVKYEDGSVKIQPIDPMAIFEYGGVGKYLKDLERRLGLEFEIKTSL